MMTKKERAEVDALRKEVGELRESRAALRELAEAILDSIRGDIEELIRDEWNRACLVDSVDTLRQTIEKLVPNPFTGRPA